MSDELDILDQALAAAEDQKKGNAIPRFYTREVQHKAKTLEAGRPIFVSLEYIEIRIPGDNRNIIDRKVLEKDIRRWPKQYEAFKKGDECQIEGTPLKQWSSLAATRVKELNAVNIHTVEQLADLPDTALKMVGMDGHTLKTKAQAFVKTAREAGFAERLAVENRQLKEDVEFLKKRMTPLIDKLDNLTTEIEKLKGGADNAAS